MYLRVIEMVYVYVCRETGDFVGSGFSLSPVVLGFLKLKFSRKLVFLVKCLY